MKSLFNAISFQMLWFACVLGTEEWSVVALVIYFVLHYCFFVTQAQEWWLILLFVGLGVVIDGALILGGWLVMPPSIWPLPTPPWLLGLWAGVGSLFFHCLSWGQTYPWRLSLLAAVSVPISYAVGADFAQVSFGESRIATMALIALIWFFVMQIGVFSVSFLTYKKGS